MKDQVFLIVSHECSASYLNLYKKIKEAATGDVFCVFHQKKNELPKELKGKNHYVFKDTILRELSYQPIGETLVPGNNHFPLLKFFIHFPYYKYYWYIESDVVYNGNWTYFFDYFTLINKDFITCHIRTFDEEPEWPWWNSFNNPDIPLNKRLRSFNPIYRISGKSLRFIHNSLLNNWSGHHEVLLPTLLYHNGFRIMDFGGKGKFVMNGCENKFYISNSPNKFGMLYDGTMRFRPEIQKIEIENKLYHPVKRSCN